jgi:membrane-bound lytic murein transglycosylase D
MRVAKLPVSGLLLVSAILAGSSCSAKKPVTVAQAAAPPAITARQTESASPGKQAQSSPSQTKAADPAISAAPTPSPDSTASSAALAPDAVADLVAQVEKYYQSGLDAFHSGQSDAAKQSFDHAFNAMLDSKLDIRSDERLEKEFDRIVQGVDQLNLGDINLDSEAQKTEPAPIDETNGITPAAEPGVEAKARAEIKSTHSDLPLMMTDQVAGYITYFSNRGRGTFERAYARSGRYHDMMVSILKEEGVPQDLIYLAQAESGFHPLAVSRVGARGIWQFMGLRARGYGLQRSQWVDDRQDPEKSTRAAARHLRDLYAQFGDWYLAMAAYNSGPGTVQAAVRRTGYADFWELYRRNVLPKETRNYVPIILAVTIMTKNLSQYGFEDVSMEDPLPYDSVWISYPVDLRLVAECVGATTAQLQELNPSLLRMTTPRDGKFELHVPAGTREQYQTAIAVVPPNMRLWWRYHEVKAGETVASLAREYRVTAKSIESANNLEGNELDAGAHLAIPLAPSKHSTESATYARRITRYKVRHGDTVETVAENFGVSPTMLRRWNGLHGDSLGSRKVLALHLPVSPGSEAAQTAARKPVSHSNKSTEVAAAKAPVRETASATADGDQETPDQAVLHHTVRSGETLYSIATAYKTTVDALKRSNGNVATLRPGMILVVQPAH